jgi:hypothetical protein
MALETDVRKFLWIDDRACGATGLFVLAARTVAGLTTHLRGILAFGLEQRVAGGVEIKGDLLVALGEAFLTDEFRIHRLRRHGLRLAHRGARGRDQDGGNGRECGHDHIQVTA